MFVSDRTPFNKRGYKNTKSSRVLLKGYSRQVCNHSGGHSKYPKYLSICNRCESIKNFNRIGQLHNEKKVVLGA